MAGGAGGGKPLRAGLTLLPRISMFRALGDGVGL